MKGHLTAVGVIHLAFGILGAIGGGLVFFLLAGIGVLSQDLGAMAVTSIVGLAVGAFLLVMSLPEIIGGIGLLQNCRWARILVLVLAGFNILNFPLGTAIGIYTFWVLLHEETDAIFQAERYEL